MSILHVNQIGKKFESIFQNKIDMSDISEKDNERKIKFLTRALAAYSIYHHCACEVEDAAASIVDGGDDNGIDAIYYSVNQKELVIVQSKWISSGASEPSSADILKFCNGVKDLVNLNFERFNEKVILRKNEITTAISSFDTRYSIILAYTGDKGLADHGLRPIQDLLNELNDAGESTVDDLVRFEKMDQSRIYNSLSKGLLSDPVDLEIGLRQWGKYSEPFNAYFGYVSAEEIAKIWEENGRKLFNRNIRNVLGKTEVNEEMQFTVQNSPEKFWYFNNGITLIADKIEKSMIGGTSNELGSFKLTNASIVNGAQTVSSIGEISSKFPEKIKKVFVHARFISLQNTVPDFENEVTRANNRQNKIENRDFVSQDPEQIRIKGELAHEGYTYNIVRMGDIMKSDKIIDVEEATACLACASAQVSLAVQAKRELGKFYENLGKGLYKQIFNPQVSGIQLLNCVLINRRIEQCITEKISDLSKKSGKDYGILVHGNRMISSFVFLKISVNKIQIMPIEELKIEEIVEEVIQKMNEFISTNFSDNFLATLFKNKTKCDLLKQGISL